MTTEEGHQNGGSLLGYEMKRICHLTDVKCISFFGYLRVHGYGLSKTMRPF